MEIKYILLVILLTGCATFDEFNRPDPWTEDQVVLQGVATALGVMDWKQTLYVADHPDEYYEVNPIIGKHPDRSRVNAYFALVIPARILVTWLIPSEWRKYWLGSNMLISGYMVYNNYKVGIRVKW